MLYAKDAFVTIGIILNFFLYIICTMMPVTVLYLVVSFIKYRVFTLGP